MKKQLLIIYCLIYLPLNGCSDNGVSPHAEDSRYIIYLSPDGNDDNSGRESSPLATLGEVQNRVKERMPNNDVIVRVFGDRGVYVNQTVVWVYYNPDHKLIFESYPDNTYAHFEASEENPPKVPFFEFRSANAEQTNLVFRRLKISNYVSRGIYILGYKNSAEYGWNGRNIIENCIFSHIGNSRMPERHFVYGAVTFVNSRDNIIRNCRIEGCANANVELSADNRQNYCPSAVVENPDSNLAINCIYIAHYSSRNKIMNNEFKNNKGDCIRLRDFSCENVISGNFFIRSGWNAVCSTWHCDFLSGICTKPTPECSSWENVFCDNIIYGTWDCLPKRSPYMDLSPGDSTDVCCKIPQEYSIKVRLENNSFFECGDL